MKIIPGINVSVLENDTHASKWVEERNSLIYDDAMRSLIMPLLKFGDTVIDVGAMIGGYAAGFKLAVGPKGTVHAFEPHPDSFECLEHNCPDVLCYRFGLGNDKDGIRYLQKDDQNYGASWLSRNENTPDGCCAHSIMVISLDGFAQTVYLNSLAMIKMDVEGMEPDVIQGGLKTIEKFRPIIYTEVNHGALQRQGHDFHGILDPLQKLNYKTRFLDARHSFDSTLWPQVDMLFMP